MTERTEPSAQLAALATAFGGTPAPCQTSDADAGTKANPTPLSSCVSSSATPGPNASTWPAPTERPTTFGVASCSRCEDARKEPAA
jgi:hypothetical protein